jgi:pimeloyl-ACP methyl ester carboxylesterase
MTSTDVAPDCRRVASPTLVLTGDAALDYVVPVDGSIAYAGLIAGARTATLDRTGHLGMVTKPEAFATVVATFANPQSANPQPAIRNPQCEDHDAA